MSKTKQTWYTKNGNDTIKADIRLLSATPNDTTVLITPKRGLYAPRAKVTEPVMGNTSGTPLDNYINVDYPWVKEKSISWNTKNLKAILDEKYYYTQSQLDDFINYKYLQ